MLNNWIPPRIVREALLLVLIAATAAVVSQIMRSDSIAIQRHRPPLAYAADSLFSAQLPDITLADSSMHPVEAGGEPVVINTAQVQRLSQTPAALILDARSPEEFALGHLPGARNLPLEELYMHENLINDLPANIWLITYCDGPSCDLGELLAWELVNRGYRRVAIYAQGITAWQQAGLPLHKEGSHEN